MKLTKQQIIEIEKLNKQGIKLREIAKQFGLNVSTISYHLNKEVRLKQIMDYFNKKSLEEKRAIYRKRKDYINNWIKNKYATDEIYREKVKQRSKNWYKRTHEAKS